MYLLLGDWSKDGHNQSDEILFESNVDVATIRKAYKDSCKLTGVSFNHNEDYTGLERDWQIADKYRIATEYEDNRISKETLDVLSKFGLTKKLLNDFGYQEDGLCKDSFVKLWIWFVKLSNPNIELKRIKEEIPYINGYWGDLNVQFGYGLYQ
jgi:hypothetical protein